MATAAPPRPSRSAGSAPGSGSGHGFRNTLIVVLVLGAVAAVAVWRIKFMDEGTGLPATAFVTYEQFWKSIPRGYRLT